MAELFGEVPDGKAVGVSLFAALAQIKAAAHIMWYRKFFKLEFGLSWLVSWLTRKLPAGRWFGAGCECVAARRRLGSSEKHDAVHPAGGQCRGREKAFGIIPGLGIVLKSLINKFREEP